jgi:hypothetical protein
MEAQMPCIVHSTSQCALRLCLSAALIVAATTWAAPGRAQGDAPKPATTQPSSTGTKPVTSATSLSEIAPKPIAVDPCKAKHPPAYCSKH